MGFRHLTSGQVPLWGRLVVLLVFAAGFLTMHGFLAVSASADVHGPHAVAHDEAHVAGAPVSEAGLHRAAEVAVGPSGRPDLPAPAEHHDLVAGCVAALVGIAVIGLALLSRFGVPSSVRATSLTSLTGRELRSAASLWSPPRVALCVIRV